SKHEIREHTFPPRWFLLADVVALQDHAMETDHHQPVRNGPHPDPPDEDDRVVFAQPATRTKPRQRIENVENEVGLRTRKRRIDIVAAGIEPFRILPLE